MYENLKINVRLTLKDIRAQSIAYVYKGILRKACLIFLLLMLFFTIYGIIIISLLSTNYENGVALAFFSITSVLFCIGINVGPVFDTYRTGKNNFKKSKALSNLQCYEFMENKIKVSSLTGILFIEWSDTYKVQELKPCFLIYISKDKFFIIPRRCFNSEAHLNVFLNLLNSKINRKKLKLKNYKIGQVSPDYGEVMISELSIKPNELDTLVPLFEISFLLSKEETLKIMSMLYCRKPITILMVFLGILHLFTYIASVNNGENAILVLIFGVIFISIVLFNIYISANKVVKNWSVRKKPYIYKFYSDYFTISYSDNIKYTRWDELIKCVEFKLAILLFINKKDFYIIPKRIFKDKNEELQILRRFALEKTSSKRNLNSYM